MPTKTSLKRSKSRNSRRHLAIQPKLRSNDPAPGEYDEAVLVQVALDHNQFYAFNVSRNCRFLTRRALVRVATSTVPPVSSCTFSVKSAT
jgi:hypothetical protein